ncbi:cytochrome P450 [Aspergillus undulatus]|uniref:cytochrome P450 n=1 Tax=Aspergillus undulatus TaxID=1810928 RepID=UPI003CCCA8A6
MGMITEFTTLIDSILHNQDGNGTSSPLVSLSILVTSFLLFNLVFLITYLTIIYPYFYSPFRHLPRPKGEIPLLGQSTTPYTKPLGSAYLIWLKSIPNTGLITYRSIFNQDRLLLTSPKAIADVLVHNTYAYTKHPAERSVIGRFLGDGLTISEGEVHRFQRRKSGPVYGARNVKGFYGVFWGKGVEFVGRIEGHLQRNSNSNGYAVGWGRKGLWGIEEIGQWATRTTMDIIGLAALEKDFGCLSGDGVNGDLFKAYQEIFTWAPEKELFMALNRILPRTVVSWLPWWVNERIDVTSATLRSACRALVRERMEDFRRTGGQGEDLMSIMMRSGGWEAEELVEQLLTIIAAGHETSASAFTWTCYLLAQHATAQDRLRAELRTVIPPLLTQTPAPNPETLSTTLESLVYLNATINETLRLIPPVPLIRRVSKHPTTILNHSIPANTHVLISPYAINRSPELWGPDAEQFKPERWIDPETARVNNHGGAVSSYANLTFSHGQRSCIGQGFARAELRALLAVFVNRFRVQLHEPAESVVPVGIVSVRPRGGLRLRIERVGEK